MNTETTIEICTWNDQTGTWFSIDEARTVEAARDRIAAYQAVDRENTGTAGRYQIVTTVTEEVPVDELTELRDGGRFAIVVGKVDAVSAYLPGNYKIVGARSRTDRPELDILLGGWDEAGWTLDTYVLPRLASGLYFGREVSLDGAVAFKTGGKIDDCK